MTRRDILTFFHEPFGDAFYFGPEKISTAHLRWTADKIERSVRAHYRYDYVLQSILSASEKESTNRIFIKDMSYHIVPPIHSPEARPPSLEAQYSSNITPNPTLLPTSTIDTFHFVFLIRNPIAAIPSLYRCFIPPLSAQTEDTSLDPTELGYRELRILFDYLRQEKGTLPLLIDADDLLAQPQNVLHHVCTHLEIPYDESMLEWRSDEDHAFAAGLFEKFAGYHEDALNSTGLVAKDRADIALLSKQEQNKDWEAKFGLQGMEVVREAVGKCQEDYEYLSSFRVLF
ncbi:MAG: hypothetical protein Q9226_004403 [Calogaya cf. arnoldii]